MKKIAAHICAVIKGMLFTGFSVQIVLGIIWMCCNFSRVQDFGEPDSALYRRILNLFGGYAAPMYLLQIALAGLAGYCFLRGWRNASSEKALAGKREKVYDLWNVLALLTFPFAIQCHLAVLPFSFMASLYLLGLFSLCRTFGAGRRRACAGKSWKPFLGYFGVFWLCMGAVLALSGAFDADERENRSGDSFEAAMARRTAWPTIWNDSDEWPEELRELTGDLLWETSYHPGNMEMLQTFIEDKVDVETAKKYYRQMTEVALKYHAPAVIKQIGWDVLGYAATPIVFPLQMAGRAYDSCTGRNYEIMRGNAPVLTRYYVDYGCWWFRWSLILSAVLLAARFCQGQRESTAGRKWILPAVLCVCISGVWIALLTMRGAGIMDYKYTIAINELWLIGELLLLGGLKESSPGV